MMNRPTILIILVAMAALVLSACQSDVETLAPGSDTEVGFDTGGDSVKRPVLLVEPAQEKMQAFYDNYPYSELSWDQKTFVLDPLQGGSATYYFDSYPVAVPTYRCSIYLDDNATKSVTTNKYLTLPFNVTVHVQHYDCPHTSESVPAFHLTTNVPGGISFDNPFLFTIPLHPAVDFNGFSPIAFRVEHPDDFEAEDIQLANYDPLTATLSLFTNYIPYGVSPPSMGVPLGATGGWGGLPGGGPGGGGDDDKPIDPTTP